MISYDEDGDYDEDDTDAYFDAYDGHDDVFDKDIEGDVYDQGLEMMMIIWTISRSAEKFLSQLETLQSIQKLVEPLLTCFEHLETILTSFFKNFLTK